MRVEHHYRYRSDNGFGLLVRRRQRRYLLSESDFDRRFGKLCDQGTYGSQVPPGPERGDASNICEDMLMHLAKVPSDRSMFAGICA